MSSLPRSSTPLSPFSRWTRRGSSPSPTPSFPGRHGLRQVGGDRQGGGRPCAQRRARGEPLQGSGRDPARGTGLDGTAGQQAQRRLDLPGGEDHRADLGRGEGASSVLSAMGRDVTAGGRAGEPARAVAEDGGYRPARRRGGARLQQHAAGDQRLPRGPVCAGRAEEDPRRTSTRSGRQPTGQPP